MTMVQRHVPLSHHHQNGQEHDEHYEQRNTGINDHLQEALSVLFCKQTLSFGLCRIVETRVKSAHIKYDAGSGSHAARAKGV